MTVHYLDASAWLKRHFEEKSGNAAVQRLFESGEPLVVSSLGWLEVNAAVARQAKAGRIRPDRYVRIQENLEQERRQSLFIETLPAHFDRAVTLARGLILSGADALHLAIAALLEEEFDRTGDELILWTSDRELFRAAEQISISVVNPDK